MKQIVLLLVTVTLATLAGCATSPDQLRKDSKFSSTVSIDRNYQEVYRDVLGQAKNCLAGVINLAVSNEVDGQLYSELGTGEIFYYMKNIRPIYYATVEIKKISDTRSIMTVHTGGQPKWASEKLGRQFIRWANGETDCQ